jgi:hypothetical protein
VRRSPLLGLVLGCGWERGGGVSGREGGGGSGGLERLEALGGHEAVVEIAVGGGRGGHREGDGGKSGPLCASKEGMLGALLGPWDLQELALSDGDSGPEAILRGSTAVADRGQRR